MEDRLRVMEGGNRVMQVIFSFLFLVLTIAAAGVDPVEFLLSKDLPRNKSEVPLPANFEYSSNPKTDCCSLALWVTIKDWSPPPDPDYYEDDSSEEPSEVKEPQIGHGIVDFTLSHPQIRDGDDTFSMNYVKNEEGQVKERFIINFNNCVSITDKIFGIYASTNIVDIKDIRIVIRDGKDIGVDCAPTTTTAPKPYNDTTTNTTPRPPIGNSIPTIVIAILGWVVAIIAFTAFCITRKQLNSTRASTEVPEKALVGAPPGAGLGGTTSLLQEENGEIKDTKDEEIKEKNYTRNQPRGSESFTLSGQTKSRNNDLCGPITKDRLPLVTGAVSVIFFIIGLTATIIYCIHFGPEAHSSRSFTVSSK